MSLCLLCWAGLACLEALELLSITATNSLGSLENIPDEAQLQLDALSDKFTQGLEDMNEGESTTRGTQAKLTDY